MIPIADLARNKWRSLLPALGVRAEFLVDKHGPCPMCQGKDRFRFDDKDGRGTYICNCCGAGDGAKLAMEVTGLNFKDLAQRVRELVGDMPAQPQRQGIDQDQAREANRRLLAASSALQPGDEPSRYLQARGLSGPYPTDLRFVASCRVQGHPSRTCLQAMIAIVRAPDGTGATIHRTYLENGAKAAMDEPRRMMPGKIAKGSAIRLGEHDGVLGIAEGIETALAVTAQFRIPCWAASNARLLADFEWPANVRELHVFGDNDPKFGGQAAAYQLAYRAATHRAPPAVVQVHIPARPGTDWLDELPAAQAA